MATPSDPVAGPAAAPRTAFRCAELLAALAESSPRVRRLLDANSTTTPLGRAFGPPKLTCLDCLGPEGRALGITAAARAVLYDGHPPTVIVCADQLQSETEIEEAAVHELVHAFDHAAGRCDFGTCEGVAYSEVRAAREAECHPAYTSHAAPAPWQALASSLSRLVTPSAPAGATAATAAPAAPDDPVSAYLHRRCVRAKALRSTANMYPAPGAAAACVDKVFDEAYRDHAPFDSPAVPSDTNHR